MFETDLHRVAEYLVSLASIELKFHLHQDPPSYQKALPFRCDSSSNWNFKWWLVAPYSPWQPPCRAHCTGCVSFGAPATCYQKGAASPAPP